MEWKSALRVSCSTDWANWAANISHCVCRNEHCPSFSQTSYTVTIPETQVYGDSFLTLTASDEDTQPPFNSVTYIVTGDNVADDYFTVNPNGEVSVARSLVTDTRNRKIYNVRPHTPHRIPPTPYPSPHTPDRILYPSNIRHGRLSSLLLKWQMVKRLQMLKLFKICWHFNICRFNTYHTYSSCPTILLGSLDR